jgi:hypothetical protein
MSNSEGQREIYSAQPHQKEQIKKFSNPKFIFKGPEGFYRKGRQRRGLRYRCIRQNR